jgi:transcriptional regulator with XRE-family HTH domain
LFKINCFKFALCFSESKQKNEATMNGKQERIALNERFKTVFEALIERGEIVLNDRKKSLSVFGEAIGVTCSNIKNYLNDENPRLITFEQAKKLCKVYGVSEDFILKGEGQPFGNHLPQSDDRLAMILNLPFSPNILFTNIEAFASNTVSVEYLEDNQRFFIPGVSGDLVAFNINGRSMEPTISSGDMVICSPLERNNDVKDGQIYAVVTSNAVYVKRAERRFDARGNCTHLLLKSDNFEEFEPFEVAVREIRKLLKVRKKLTGLL